MGGIKCAWRQYAPSLLLLLAACSGRGLEVLPSESRPAEPSPAGDVEVASEPNDGSQAEPQPTVPQPGEPPLLLPEGEPDVLEPPAPVESDACRFVILRDDGEVQIAWASGETRLLTRTEPWTEATGSDVATVGQFAMVGRAAPDFRGTPTLMFIHAQRGVLYEGVQPHASDYTRAMGFQSITREGFALLNDGSVLDGRGAQHHVPEAGFAAVVPNIDEQGYVLIERAGELAYWDVAGDRLDRTPTEAVGQPLVRPLALGGIEGHEVAFVEDRGGGEMSFTRLSRDGFLRAPLSPAAVQVIQGELDEAERGELYIYDQGWRGDAALLVAAGRPLAWARAGHAPIAIDVGTELAPTGLVRSYGGCFTGTSDEASSAEELAETTWRVSAEDGTFERGLRFPIPAGLELDVTGGGVYPLPVCLSEGRLAVMLRGASGFAWFSEGDSGFEQLTPWTPERPGEPEEALEIVERPASERRIIATWHRITAPERCEYRYDETGTTLIDHALGVEHSVAVTGYLAVEWLETPEPAL